MVGKDRTRVHDGKGKLERSSGSDASFYCISDRMVVSRV